MAVNSGCSREQLEELLGPIVLGSSREGNCGRPEKLPIGSTTLSELGERILGDEQHQDMPWSEVAKEMGLDIARSTIEKAVHNHLDIHRYKPERKPPLGGEDQVKRYNFALWAIAKLDRYVRPELFSLLQDC